MSLLPLLTLRTPITGFLPLSTISFCTFALVIATAAVVVVVAADADVVALFKLFTTGVAAGDDREEGLVRGAFYNCLFNGCPCLLGCCYKRRLRYCKA